MGLAGVNLLTVYQPVSDRAVLLAADNLGPKTSLTTSIADRLGANGVSIVEKMIGAKPRNFARLAGLVFAAADSGDEVAAEINCRRANYLSELSRQLWATNPPAISLLGGLRDIIIPLLDDDFASRISAAKHPADVGAVMYAQRRFK